MRDRSGMKTRLRRTIWSAMAAALLAGAAVDANAQLSLSTAVDLALKSDPRVKAAEAEVRKAEAVLSEARDVYVPNVGVKGGYGASSGVPLTVPVVFSLASESLLFNFSQKDNVRAANDGLQAAKLALRETRDQTVEDAVVTYMNLDSAERRRATMEDESGYASRLEKIVQERLDAGQDSRMDLLKAQRTRAQIHVAALNAEDEIATLTDHLGRLMGVPSLPIATVSDSIPALPAIASLRTDTVESPGVQSAFASAMSKQEQAFGEARYRYRPQIAFGANYSRITTAHTSYTTYYPGFNNQHSDNALSVGIEIRIPILDFEHQAHAREVEADAAHAMAEALSQRSQFLDGRFKLRHSLDELAARVEVASLDRDIAQEQLETVQIQLNGSGPGATQLTPKDEQNAKLQERQRQMDVLQDEFALRQAEVNLMRQTGALGDWLKQSLPAAGTSVVTH